MKQVYVDGTLGDSYTAGLKLFKEKFDENQSQYIVVNFHVFPALNITTQEYSKISNNTDPVFDYYLESIGFEHIIDTLPYLADANVSIRSILGDEIHFNERGYGLVAEIVYNYMLENNLTELK